MKKVTITFGRMNPPTIGHEKLVAKLMMVAKSKASQPRIYLSHTQNAKKDPLSYKAKVSVAKAAFGKAVKVSKEKNIVGVMKSLEKEKFTDVTLVVGSDRVSEFRSFLNKYNGTEFNFNSITVVSAGERDPDAEGVSGVSASKMRALAKSGDEKSFMGGAPSNLSNTEKKKLYKDVRAAMNIHEAKETEKDDDLEVSDDELDAIVDKMSDEDMDANDDDVVLAKHIFPDDADELEDDDEEDDDEEEMKEARVLTFQQRQKVAQRMRRLAKRFSRLRAIKRKRMATPDRLKFRARKAALMVLRRRAAGARGQKYSQLSRGERISIDKMVANRYKKNLSNIVGRFAARLMPRIRKKEMERLKKARMPKNESVDTQFENFLNEFAPTSHIAPTASPLLGSDENPTDKDSRRKIDTLLRLGLVPRDELQKYRRALRNKEAAIKSPELRNKIGDLLDRLLKISTSDAAIYQKLRMKAGETKEDIERAADYKRIKTKVRMPDGSVKYVWKKERSAIDIGKGKYEAADPMAVKHDREREALKLRQTRERAAAQVKKVRQDNLKDDVSVKAIMNLQKKSEISGIDFDTIFEVFMSEENPNKRFNRVDSFIAHNVQEKVDKPTGGLKDACWKGYTAVGMKMKNGKKVPNCVPEEEQTDESIAALARKHGMANVMKARDDAAAKKGPNKAMDRALDAIGKAFSPDAQKKRYARNDAKRNADPGYQKWKERKGIKEDVEEIDENLKKYINSITSHAMYHVDPSADDEHGSERKKELKTLTHLGGKVVKHNIKTGEVTYSHPKYGKHVVDGNAAQFGGKGKELIKKIKEIKEASSALKRLQAFDKSRVAAGKPAIFDVNKKKEEPKKPVKESLDESFVAGIPDTMFVAGIPDTMYAKDFEEHRVQGGFSLHPSVVAETIRKEDGKYVIYSKDGSKKLGEYDSEEAAKKRLRQIEFFKRQG